MSTALYTVATLQVFEAVSRGVSFFFQKERDELTVIGSSGVYVAFTFTLSIRDLVAVYSFINVCDEDIFSGIQSNALRNVTSPAWLA